MQFTSAFNIPSAFPVIINVLSIKLAPSNKNNNPNRDLVDPFPSSLLTNQPCPFLRTHGLAHLLRGRVFFFTPPIVRWDWVLFVFTDALESPMSTSLLAECNRMSNRFLNLCTWNLFIFKIARSKWCIISYGKVKGCSSTNCLRQYLHLL